tara:strand:+ start:1734 stop:2216 length:483 start_codon:yes stop_codon:yes gene_type:complete
MPRPLGFKDFLSVDYTQTGDGQLAKNAKRRKDIGPAGSNAEYSSTNSPSKSEALTVQQRLAKSRQMKKLKSKIALGRKRAERKVASIDVLKKRAQKQARNFFAKKITKGQDKGELGMARRADIEKRLDKMKPKIDKLARKMLPKIRKAEIEKKKGGGSGN